MGQFKLIYSRCIQGIKDKIIFTQKNAILLNFQQQSLLISNNLYLFISGALFSESKVVSIFD